MYLTKPQYAAIISINVGSHETVAPAIIEFLLQHGQIIETLIGYDLTDAGRISLDENYVEHQRQKTDVRTGPSGKRDFHQPRRDTFRADDDLTINKRRSLDPGHVPKSKPPTRYK